jgi:hypothetical protein
MVNNLGSLGIGPGDHVWIRAYHYFPVGFCFSSDPDSGAPEGNWGNIKWYRFEFSGERRNTIQIGDLGGTAIATEPTCGATAGWGGMTDEYGGNGENKAYPSASPAPAEITRGSWLALQTHIYFQSDNTGYAENWVNDTYLGRLVSVPSGATTFPTCPTSGALSFIVFGDYWNGYPGFTQDFYIDDIVITSQTPNTVDSGGRPYISPTTRVSDF